MENIPITESTEFLKPSYEGRHSIEETNSGEGVQKIWRYKNGYGASAVKFGFYPIEITKQIWNAKTIDEVNKLKIKARKQIKSGSYGQSAGFWEMGIISFEKDGTWNLNYKTIISDDVIGYLNKKGIEKHLRQIKNLPDYEPLKFFPGEATRNISDNFYHQAEKLKHSSNDIQSNCSEQVFRLKGTFDEIKKSVLGMVDCIEKDFIDYDKELTIRDKKRLAELTARINGITKLEEFNYLMIDWTTNYETYFKLDNNDVLVATCNNIDWDLINAIPDSSGYYSVRGKNDYDVKLVYEDKLLIEKTDYDEEEDRSPPQDKLVLVLNKDLHKYYISRDSKFGEYNIIQLMKRNDTYYLLPNNNVTRPPNSFSNSVICTEGGDGDKVSFESNENGVMKAKFCDDIELITKLKIIANLQS
jgi:hypothetical protein